MIRYIKHKAIDFEKYDACIKNAKNARIYALSTYLNTVAHHWDVLVLRNYEAVMPLPWNRKYGIKYIYPPCWTQQLGVFSAQNIDKELMLSFLKAIPKVFLKTTLQLNTSCGYAYHHKKVNYVLKLEDSYENLYKNYRKDRRDRLKKFKKSGLSITVATQADDIIELFKNSYTYSKQLNIEDYQKLIVLSEQQELQPVILKIYNADGVLISGSIFFKDHHRIYYLFSANNKEGNKIQGNTAILDNVIYQYAKTHRTLDFEGSMIPGIASFFKSFGSEVEDYYLFSKRFAFLCNSLKK